MFSFHSSYLTDLEKIFPFLLEATSDFFSIRNVNRMATVGTNSLKHSSKDCQKAAAFLNQQINCLVIKRL